MIDLLRIIVISLVLGGGTVLAGCNTMEDVEAGGEAVQDASEDAEEELED